MVRNSARFVSHKDLKKPCADLKAVYAAAAEEAGRGALEEFGKIQKCPMIPILGRPVRVLLEPWRRHLY
jgi:transposase-like protein